MSEISSTAYKLLKVVNERRHSTLNMATSVFKYLVMPFSLYNAPASFQVYINNTLYKYLDDFCIAYIDNVFVYTHSTLKEHI